MIRTRMRYHRPATAEEASAILAERHGNVAVLGGGTQLLPRMNRDEVHLEHVVDLRDLGLDTITVHDGHAHVGATATYAGVLASAELRAAVPLLAKVCRGVTGGPQLLQQATLVGSACFNYPGTDVPAVLVALGARLRLHGPSGVREVPAAEFLLGAYQVDLGPGEFVTAFAVDDQPEAGYCKVKHAAGSWPIATAAAVRDQRTGALSITVGAVQALPVRFELDDRARLSEQVRELITDPWSDVLAPGGYRAAIAAAVARRAVTDLLEAAA